MDLIKEIEEKKKYLKKIEQEYFVTIGKLTQLEELQEKEGKKESK